MIETAIFLARTFLSLVLKEVPNGYNGKCVWLADANIIAKFYKVVT